MYKYAPDVSIGNTISYEGERFVVTEVKKAGRLYMIKGPDGESIILSPSEHVRLLA